MCAAVGLKSNTERKIVIMSRKDRKQRPLLKKYFPRRRTADVFDDLAEQTWTKYKTEYKSGYRWLLEALDDVVYGAAFRETVPRGFDMMVGVDVKKGGDYPWFVDNLKTALRTRDSEAVKLAIADGLRKLMTEFKKKGASVRTAQDANPGTVSTKLQRRMGPDLTTIFNEAGTKLYSNSVLTIKEGLRDIFQEAIDSLTETIQDELGRKGKAEAAEHFGPFIKEVVASVMKEGMGEISDSLEDLASSAAAEFIQSAEEAEPEAGEEELFGVEDVEEVEEEPVEEPPEEEAPAEGEEEIGFEELMGGEPEAPAEGSVKPDVKQPRRWKSKKPVRVKQGEVLREADLELRDVLKIVGGKKGLLKRRVRTAQQAFTVLHKAQMLAIRQLTAQYASVAEVPAETLKDWATTNFPRRAAARKRRKRSQFGLPPTMADEVEQIDVASFFNEEGFVRDWNQVGEEVDSWGGGPGQSFGTAYELKKIGPRDASREDVAAAEQAAARLTKEWEDFVAADEGRAYNHEDSGYRFEIADYSDGYYLVLTQYAWDV